jgi:hypothetical protein
MDFTPRKPLYRIGKLRADEHRVFHRKSGVCGGMPIAAPSSVMRLPLAAVVLLISGISASAQNAVSTPTTEPEPQIELNLGTDAEGAGN